MDKNNALENIPDTLLLELAKKAVKSSQYIMDTINAEILDNEKFGKHIHVYAKNLTLKESYSDIYLGEYGIIDNSTNNYKLYNPLNRIETNWLKYISQANLGHTIKGKSYSRKLEDQQIELLLIKQEIEIRKVCEKILEEKHRILNSIDVLTSHNTESQNQDPKEL